VALDVLMLALVLGLGAEVGQSRAAPQPQAAPAKAETQPEAKAAAKPAAKAEAKPEAKAASGKLDVAKLMADLAAEKQTAAKTHSVQVRSRPRRTATPNPPAPPAARYQLRWPSFEERWHITWPQPPADRLALVWPGQP
jgi:hypothetical protein